MEILHQSLINCSVLRVTTIIDEILVFCMEVDQDPSFTVTFTYNIRVYYRNNMAALKDVFALPGIDLRLGGVAACSVTNCFYVREQYMDTRTSSIFRIKRDDKHPLHVQTWITCLSFSFGYMSVSAEGSLLIISKSEGFYCDAVSIYDTSGCLQRQVILFPDDIPGYRCVKSVIEKSNGNLIILAYVGQQFET